MDKQRIRKAMLERRRGLDSHLAAQWGAAIRLHLSTHKSYLQATALLSYVSSKDNEVDTRPVILDSLRNGLPVFVPRTGPAHTMDWVALESLDDLLPGKHGILEPDGAKTLEAFDQKMVALVPGIAFDRHGNRIGYGWGYFDRFLATFPGPKVGLAYAAQVVEDVPVEDHDVAVDWLVSEFGVAPCIPE